MWRRFRKHGNNKRSFDFAKPSLRMTGFGRSCRSKLRHYQGKHAGSDGKTACHSEAFTKQVLLAAAMMSQRLGRSLRRKIPLLQVPSFQYVSNDIIGSAAKKRSKP